MEKEREEKRRIPTLNSKTTTTVRIAQTEYLPSSSKGFFKKIRKERRVKASPIFAE